MSEEAEDAFDLRFPVSGKRLRALIERLPAVVYLSTVTPMRSMRYVSARVEQLLGIPPGVLIGDHQAWLTAVHPDDRSSVLATHRAATETGGPFVAEYRMLTATGQSVWVRDEASLVHDGDEPQWQGLLIDITERKLSKERLEFLAFHDAVTGLPNAAFFEHHLELEVARARRTKESLVVCCLDLDRFKLVNDTLGHAAGDEFLREVALRLQAFLRESDLVARVGGDEFAALGSSLPSDAGTSPPMMREAAEHFSSRLAEALEPVFVLGEIELHMSASIGTAVFPIDGQTPRELLERADATMYRSKRERDADRIDDSGGGEHVAGELSLASALRRAARHRSWTLVHQPIVELVLGRTVGAEALLRWHDPVHGAVEPRRFIAMAEEMGLIASLGGWVIERLTHLCREWAASGTLEEMRLLTCNLSPRELWHPSLIERLRTLREAAGRDGLIVVEITESSLLMDPARAKDILEHIRDLGLRIALDDFGTGYSSLSRLQSLPIDLVKIDRTFLGHLDDPSARQIVQAMIRLANALGMVTIAEGIESPEQLRFVTESGCTLAQGYLFSRPLSAEELVVAVGQVSPAASDVA